MGGGGGCKVYIVRAFVFIRTHSPMDVRLLLGTLFAFRIRVNHFLFCFAYSCVVSGLPRSWSYPREACVVPWYVESGWKTPNLRTVPPP